MDHEFQNGALTSASPPSSVEAGNYAAQRLLDYRLTTENGLKVISPMERKASSTRSDDRQATAQ
jgi:hypothetical protein